jgi:hypothetical protein
VTAAAWVWLAAALALGFALACLVVVMCAVARAVALEPPLRPAAHEWYAPGAASPLARERAA